MFKDEKYWAIPQLGCTEYLIYQKDDLALLKASTLSEVVIALGKCTYHGKTPPKAIGLMMDFSGGMTNAVATSTALTNANDDSQIWVEVDTEDFNVDGRDRYCRGALVIAGAGGTATFSGVVLGANTRYHPASDYDLATVAQITNS